MDSQKEHLFSESQGFLRSIEGSISESKTQNTGNTLRSCWTEAPALIGCGAPDHSWTLCASALSPKRVAAVKLRFSAAREPVSRGCSQATRPLRRPAPPDAGPLGRSPQSPSPATHPALTFLCALCWNDIPVINNWAEGTPLTSGALLMTLTWTSGWSLMRNLFLLKLSFRSLDQLKVLILVLL